MLTYGLLGLLSLTLQDHVLRGGIAHNELGPPSITNQENGPQACLQASMHEGGVFSVEVFSSQMTVACVKLI